MADIVLATLNAKFIHSSFGLRCLLANMGDLQSRTCLVEFDIHQRALDIAEVLLARAPRIIGLGVYIWNVAETTAVVAAVKRLRPDIIIILGGPEVSYEPEEQEIVRLADHVITGEADLKFAEVCAGLLRRDPGADDEASTSRPPKLIPAELPQLDRLALPYELYGEEDIAHRVIYVEASRGCPFTCEFCLSSLDIPVRQFPLEPFLAAMDRLLARGVKQFKFVDRTFNLNLHVSRAILNFFLERMRPGLFVHFEMVPDRLPEALRAFIAHFPPGSLQFEVGIQTFDEATMRNISRRQDLARIEDNFQFLREHTGVHIHADLIVGLPGEDLASFARGFDRLVALRPQEIQVGILKRLRGTPIVRHDVEWGMVYSADPPYELLQNRLLDFATMQRLRRFARFWDVIANSGNFAATAPLILAEAPDEPGAETSAFGRFLTLSDWLFAKLGRRHAIAREVLVERLFVFLTQERRLPASRVAAALIADGSAGPRPQFPGCLQPWVTKSPAERRGGSLAGLPQRQRRHLERTTLAAGAESDG